MLIFIFADTCNACNIFKKKLPELDIKNSDKIIINFETTGSPLPKNYPEGLVEYIGFFPTILMIKEKNYNNNGLSDIKNVKIFNGIKKDKNLPSIDKKYKMDVKGVIKWIEENSYNDINELRIPNSFKNNTTFLNTL